MLQIQESGQSLVHSGQINGTIKRTGTHPRDIFKTNGTHEITELSQMKRQCVPNQSIQSNTKKESVPQGALNRIVAEITQKDAIMQNLISY